MVSAAVNDIEPAVGQIAPPMPLLSSNTGRRSTLNVASSNSRFGTDSAMTPFAESMAVRKNKYRAGELIDARTDDALWNFMGPRQCTYLHC